MERDPLITRAPKIEKIEGYPGSIHPVVESKEIKMEDLKPLGEYYRNRKKTMVFTQGTFDMVHLGHAMYLHLGRSLGDVLFVGLNSDVSVKKYKGPNRPILPQSFRLQVLSFLEPVDYIILFDSLTTTHIVKELKPDIYFCAEGTWDDGTYLEDREEVVAVKEYGGKTVWSPRQAPNLSTTDIVKKIEAATTKGVLADLAKIAEEHPDMPAKDIGTILEDRVADGQGLKELKGFFANLNGHSAKDSAKEPVKP